MGGKAIQGFGLRTSKIARQVLYNISHILRSFALVIFQMGFHHFVLGWSWPVIFLPMLPDW
jgi:hypothetical protein